MIFSNTPIKSKSILVRFYNYSDTEKGYGDSGTAGYFRIDMKNFEMIEKTRFDGSKYYNYHLQDEVGQSLFGRYWGIGHGYEQTSETKRKAELKKVEEALKKIKEVQSI